MKRKRGADSARRPKAGAKKAAGPEASLQSRLAVQAHHLRVLLREVSLRFVSDVESALVRSVEMLSEIADGGKKEAELKKILQEIQSLRLKPDKGRLGDLRRIRDLVGEMNRRLEEML
jgi:hypothetical protein